MSNFNEENKQHIIYSDGACSGNPGVGGWAFIHITPDGFVYEASGYDPSTTNNRMEMTAALEGLRRLADGDSVILLTDSVYLIRGITQWVFGWQKRSWKNAEGKEVLNRDIWEHLLRAIRGKKIEWRYIPGHSGFSGNERVDQLAVAQSLKRPMKGYHGSISEYQISVTPIPEKIPIPEMKKNNGVQKAKGGSYLSLVNGVLERHLSWDQCQARVKGVSQAKFKRVQTDDEASEVIRSWGLDPKTLVLKRE